MKAMILAAGRGERLRPLTESIPKPLVEVAGQTLLGRHLHRLARAGFTRAVINVSHFAEKITDRFGDGSREGLRIEWSREAAPLETANAVATRIEISFLMCFLSVQFKEQVVTSPLLRNQSLPVTPCPPRG